MKNKLSLAVVGCGDIAQFMALFARLTPGVRLAAACDISRQRAETFAGKYRIPSVFTNYGEMLSAGGYDAVYLAVPHNLHSEMIRSAVDAGFHIFTEKPITRSFAFSLPIT